MRPDHQAIVHRLEPRTVKVWLCGDVHVGSEGCDLHGFERFLDRVMEDDDAFVVFVGDLMDNATRNSKSDLWQGMSPSEQMDYIAKVLTPLAKAGKILALVAGNHELRTARETDIEPLYTVAVRLGIENVYRRDFAAIRIQFGEFVKIRKAYNILAFHGASDFKTRQMMNNIEGFDALVTGHTHQPVTRMPAHLCLTQKGMVALKEVIQVTACSWCDYQGYGARGMYQPQVQSRPQCLILEWANSQHVPKRISVSW